MTQSQTIDVTSTENLLEKTATLLLEKFQHLAPDYSSVSVLLPHSHAATQFYHALLKAMHCEQIEEKQSAIIPPWCGTLNAWTKQFSDNGKPDHTIINNQARQLLFIEALQQNPDLFKEENQWQVAEALLNLFDELNLNQQGLFSSQQDFTEHLQHAYGISAEHDIELEHLNFESKLVFTLWKAWQVQLSENKLLDETSDYIHRLKVAESLINNSEGSSTTEQHFLCLDEDSYSLAELAFINKLNNQNQCTLLNVEKILTSQSVAFGSSVTLSDFIKQTFQSSETSFAERATNFPTDQLNNQTNFPVSTYLAANEESQVRAIDYYVRSQLLQGKSNIAIISEDRKLSRRLRALLERADIVLQDNAGWSLATTQAATIVERWLECIEEDFSAYPLLDCLKSPYLDISNIFYSTDDSQNNDNNDAQTDELKKHIYRFEQDIVFHENIRNNIAQYRQGLINRKKRLHNWPTQTYQYIDSALKLLDEIAAPLQDLYNKDKIKLTDFIEALSISLNQLGVLQRYQFDEAGQLLLATFEQLKQSTLQANPELNWQDCRLWLGMALENLHFAPKTNSTNVQLMTLEQSSSLKFDCVVIASCEPQHYPGSANNHPLFNQSVRASLQLPTWEQQRERKHEYFCQTLLSSPDVLITACSEEKGEPKPVSPWLELLRQFYTLSTNRSLENQELHKLVANGADVATRDTALPQQSMQPSPSLSSNNIPVKVSASSYQRLINCPYQFFSADGLQLKPKEELSDELKKADYGERIHLILQCFHSGHDFYGDAFSEKITSENFQHAEQYLNQLSEKVFLQDLEDNVLHRSWLYRWQKHIPAYLNWQMKQQQVWDILQCENRIDIQFDEHTSLTGRLDRTDINVDTASHAIIDYKTGLSAKQEDVDSGENVQLSTYALLDKEATDVSYVSLDSSTHKVETKATLSDDELQYNRKENEARLQLMFDQLHHQQSMPAWGDESVCQYCNFSGLCRKTEWSS